MRYAPFHETHRERAKVSFASLIDNTGLSKGHPAFAQEIALPPC